jgi:hypothetical protein
MVSTAKIHDNIVASWRTGEEKTLYKIIVVKANGTVSLLNRTSEPPFDPQGNEENLRDFLFMFVR